MFIPLIILLVIISNHHAESACSISIQTDLSSTAPLLLTSTHTFYLPTQRDKRVNFQSNEVILLSCPNGAVTYNGVSQGTNPLNIKCANSGNHFVITNTGQTAMLSHFGCSNPKKSDVKFTGKSCLGQHKEIEIGFQVSASVFLRQITICFDQTLQTTLYSSFTLTKWIGQSQTPGPRPQFEGESFYNLGNSKIYQFYSCHVQRRVINRQLGLPIDSNKYFNPTEGDRCMNKGHLSANADFVYASQQNATFYYMNTAPQWKSVNNGNWNELEYSVRKLARTLRQDLEVYTGTHGIATLPHASAKRETPLYLYTNNNKLALPVPRMFWKVVYCPVTKAGIAFVTLNNPYTTNVHSDTLCKSVCNSVSYELKWEPQDINAGYSYCCDVNVLRNVVPSIPNLPITSILL